MNIFINSCHYLRPLSARAPLPLWEDNSRCAASPKILGDFPNSSIGKTERRDAAVQKLHIWPQKLAEVCVQGQSHAYSFHCVQGSGENAVGSLAAVAEGY